MKTTVSPYDQKATAINYTTAFMAKQAGDRLVELITNGWEPSGNLQQWHSDINVR